VASNLAPRVDFASFHRFLVSLGVLLIAAAVLVPWLILRESGALLVTRAELSNLTETGREAIESKQTTIAALLQVWPFLSAALLATGTSLVIVGLVRWRRRQAVLDRVEDLGREKLENEVRQLTPTEITEKLERETAESQPPATVPRGDIRAQLLEIEVIVSEKLGEAFSGTHVVESNVAVRSKSGQAEIDAVVKALVPEGTDLVVEIKYQRYLGALFGEWILRTARNRQLYSEATGRKANAALFAVLETADRDHVPSPQRIHERFDRYRTLVAPPVAVVVHTRDELAEIPPGRLRQEFEEATAELGD
jgi:hypothetical protein